MVRARAEGRAKQGISGMKWEYMVIGRLDGGRTYLFTSSSEAFYYGALDLDGIRRLRGIWAGDWIAGTVWSLDHVWIARRDRRV